MSSFVIFIALAHGLPILLAGINFGRWAARFTAIIMVPIGIFTGSPIYILIDLIGIGFGLKITETFIDALDYRLLIEKEAKPQESSVLKKFTFQEAERKNPSSIQEEQGKQAKKFKERVDMFSYIFLGVVFWVVVALTYRTFFLQKEKLSESTPVPNTSVLREKNLSESTPVPNENSIIRRNSYLVGTQAPPIWGEEKNTDELSKFQVYWCVAQLSWLDALRVFAITSARVNAFNRLIDDYNLRCGYAQHPEYFRNTAIRLISKSQPSIEKDAILWAAVISSQNISEIPQNHGDLTREIQIFLGFLGFDPGPIDGLYGRKTEKAIREFQASANLTISGEITENLWKNLIQRTRKSGTPS